MAKQRKKIAPFLFLSGIGLIGYIAVRKSSISHLKYLNKYFSKEDVTASTIANQNNLEIQYNPASGIYENADFIAKNFLNPLAKKYGRQAIEVDSWYRSADLNNMVGGVSGSFHLNALAVDVDLLQNGFLQNDLILDFIVAHDIPFTELGLEYGTISNPQTIHYAYVPGRNEKQVFRMTANGTTVNDYKWLVDRFR